MRTPTHLEAHLLIGHLLVRDWDNLEEAAVLEDIGAVDVDVLVAPV